MTKQYQNIMGLSKTTVNHGSYTEFAAEGVRFLNGLPSVHKISPGVITARPFRGFRSLNVILGKEGGLELKFVGNGTQMVYVVTSDPAQTLTELRTWAKSKEGNCVVRERAREG